MMVTSSVYFCLVAASLYPPKLVIGPSEKIARVHKLGHKINNGDMQYMIYLLYSPKKVLKYLL